MLAFIVCAGGKGKLSKKYLESSERVPYSAPFPLGSGKQGHLPWEAEVGRWLMLNLSRY